MEKIRVLHIIKTLDLGGAETNLLNLVGVLDSKRVETFVAYSSGGDLEDRFRKAGVRLFKFATHDHKISSLATFGIILRLIRFIRENRIHIVHTHTFTVHVWGGIAAKMTGAKLVEHVHDLRYLEREEFLRRRGTNRQFKFVHMLRNFSDRVVVLTRQNMEFIARHHLYPFFKVHELHNGISMPRQCIKDKESATRWRDRLGIARNAVVILSAARMAPEKNIDLVIRIAPEVIAADTRVVFVIAGDGPLLESFQKQVLEKGLSRVIRLIGFEADMHGLLNMSDIFLLPSFLELHSIAVLEAMSLGLAMVISRDVGCHTEFIRDQENGILLDPFTDGGWARSLIELVRDARRRELLGRNAFQTCRDNFDINVTARNFERIYAELA